jgi:hypothetical protein
MLFLGHQEHRYPETLHRCSFMPRVTSLLELEEISNCTYLVKVTKIQQLFESSQNF